MSCIEFKHATTSRINSHADVRHPDDDSDAFGGCETSSGLLTLNSKNPHQ